MIVRVIIGLFFSNTPLGLWTRTLIELGGKGGLVPRWKGCSLMA